MCRPKTRRAFHSCLLTNFVLAALISDTLENCIRPFHCLPRSSSWKCKVVRIPSSTHWKMVSKLPHLLPQWASEIPFYLRIFAESNSIFTAWKMLIRYCLGRILAMTQVVHLPVHLERWDYLLTHRDDMHTSHIVPMSHEISFLLLVGMLNFLL